MKKAREKCKICPEISNQIKKFLRDIIKLFYLCPNPKHKYQNTIFVTALRALSFDIKFKSLDHFYFLKFFKSIQNLSNFNLKIELGELITNIFWYLCFGLGMAEI